MNRQFVLPLVALATLLLTSCASTREAASGRTFEDDEVYLSPKRTFITDIQASTEALASSSESEDYYDPNSTSAQSSKLDMWNRTGYGYGTNGGFNSNWANNWNLGWMPYNGWGYNTGFGNHPNLSWNMGGFGCPSTSMWGWPYSYGSSPWGWGMNNGFNNGFFNYGYPYMNGFGYPFGTSYYYNPWFNSYYGMWNTNSDGGTSGNVSSGHRRPISSNSTLNTSSSANTGQRDTPRSLESSGTSNSGVDIPDSAKPSRSANSGISSTRTPSGSERTPAMSQERTGGKISTRPSMPSSGEGRKDHWSAPASRSTSVRTRGVDIGSSNPRSQERTIDWGNGSGPSRSGGDIGGGGKSSGGSIGGGGRSSGGSTGGGGGTHRR